MFIDCKKQVDKIYSDISDLGLELEKLPNKDLKKLTLHYFVTNVFLKRNKRLEKEKPVYYINSNYLSCIEDKRYLDSLNYVVKKLNQLLPVPLITLDPSILKRKNGDYKGLCEKMLNLYVNRKIETKKLKRFLEVEEYYELMSAFKDIVNIKTVVT